MSNPLTSGNVSKLPVWAQRLIETLRADIEYHQAETARMLGEGESRAFLDNYTSERKPLPHDRISFDLSDNPQADTYLGKIQVRPTQDRHGNWYLEIYSGHGSIAIRSQSSNIIQVRAEG